MSDTSPARIDTILAAARAHAAEVIAPAVDDWNRAAKWPRAASDAAGAAGLTGLYAPEEWGGQGLPLSEGIRVYEELGRADGALPLRCRCTTSAPLPPAVTAPTPSRRPGRKS